MKSITLVMLALLFCMLSPVHGKEVTKPHSVVPKEGFVPDEATAIHIAVAIWNPIYGKENIDGQKPYTAYLKEGVWYVFGHLPKDAVGGVAVAEIRKSDCCILRISHGK